MFYSYTGISTQYWTLTNCGYYSENKSLDRIHLSEFNCLINFEIFPKAVEIICINNQNQLGKFIKCKFKVSIDILFMKY